MNQHLILYISLIVSFIANTTNAQTHKKGNFTYKVLDSNLVNAKATQWTGTINKFTITFDMSPIDTNSIAGKKRIFNKLLNEFDALAHVFFLQNDTAYTSKIKYHLLDSTTIYVDDFWNKNSYNSINSKNINSTYVKGKKYLDSLVALKYRVIQKYKHLKMDKKDSAFTNNFSADSFYCINNIYIALNQKAKISLIKAMPINHKNILDNKESLILFDEEFKRNINKQVVYNYLLQYRNYKQNKLFRINLK